MTFSETGLKRADADDLALSNLFAEEEDDQAGLDAMDGDETGDDSTLS